MVVLALGLGIWDYDGGKPSEVRNRRVPVGVGVGLGLQARLDRESLCACGQACGKGRCGCYLSCEGGKEILSTAATQALRVGLQ